MIVVDCAAVVDALVLGSDAAELRSMLAAHEMHAPALLDYEFAAVLRRMALSGRLSEARAADALDDFADLPIERWSSSPGLRRRILQLRNTVSAYDAAYVVLAESLGCPLITRDRRLAGTKGHTVTIEVR